MSAMVMTDPSEVQSKHWDTPGHGSVDIGPMNSS